jgi:hypothetical protein
MAVCSSSNLHFISLSHSVIPVTCICFSFSLFYTIFLALPQSIYLPLSLTASHIGSSSTPRPPKAQTSQKTKGSSVASSQKKKINFTSRSPDLMNLFVDSTKSSKSATLELEGCAADDGMSGKDWQRTSEISFPSFSPFDGNGKTGRQTKKESGGGRAILAESEEWTWQWDSSESGGDREETIAWLAGVTEVTVRHISVPRALSEVSVHAHRLPSVTALQLVDNGITTQHQVRTECIIFLLLTIVGVCFDSISR